MDSYTPQGGTHVRTGHEESDINLRGVIMFIVILVISAGVTFLAASGLLRLFEWYAKTHEPQATPAQQQLHEERGELAKRKGARPQPDWYDREIDAKVLQRTFATPRLQDDDANDLRVFVESEEDRLANTGKDPDGSIHIPIDRAIDLLSQRGLPAVSGTFTPGLQYGNLTDVADAARRRLNDLNAGAAQQKK